MLALLLASSTPTSSVYNSLYGARDMLIGIAIFFAVIFGAYFLLRWFTKRAYGGSGRIRVIERSMVGRDTYIMLVRVGSRVLLVGSNKDGMSLLCELRPGELEGTEATGGSAVSGGEPQNGSTFTQRFIHNMKIQTGLLPKDTPPMYPEQAARPDTPEKSEDDEPTPEEAAHSFAAILQRVQDSVSQTENTVQSPSQPPESVAPSPVERSPAPVQVSGKNGSIQDYDTIIQSLHDLGQIVEGRRVVPVAPRAAAATYAAAARPPRRPPAEPEVPPPAPPPPELKRREPEKKAQMPPPLGPPESIIPLIQLKPKRAPESGVAPVVPETEDTAGAPAPVPPGVIAAYSGSKNPPNSARAERQLAAQKLAERAAANSDDPDMDELFDKIQQRSSRYSRKKDAQEETP